MVIEQINNSIKLAKNILIVSHINPDGDTLGTMCGLYSLIKDNYKKTCQMLAVSEIPTTYYFLPYITKVNNIENTDLSREYDLVINVDIAALDRCGDAQLLFNKAKNTINIDHHETNPHYAKINIVDKNASATAELLMEIALKLDWEISKDSATCLYTGILTDTGGFKFSNTTGRTFELSGKLINKGINISEIYKKCYESNSKDMVLFQAYCINKAQFIHNEKIAYTTVYKKDLEKFRYNGEDFTEGLTDKLRAIKTTEIAFVIKELNATTSKVSMRSKNIDIAKICQSFGGGGHKLAAGAIIKANVEQATKIIIKEINNKKLC